MTSKDSQLGTLSVKQRSQQTTFPVHSANFGVIQFTDKADVYFIVEAGEAIAGPAPAKDGPVQPRMNAHVYEDEFAVSDLSGLTLFIPAPLAPLKEPGSSAFFNYYAHYAEPVSVGPCTIQIGEGAKDVYPIRWQATLDDETEIEVKADFTLNEIREFPCSYKPTSTTSFDRAWWILTPLCSVAGYIAASSTGWLYGWVGILLGIVVATYIARKIDARSQQR